MTGRAAAARGTVTPPPSLALGPDNRPRTACAKCGVSAHVPKGRPNAVVVCWDCRRRDKHVTDIPAELAEGVCVGHPRNWWIADRPGDETRRADRGAVLRWKRNVRRAASLCVECPVRDVCADYALRTNQSSGVWGGWYLGGTRPIRVWLGELPK